MSTTMIRSSTAIGGAQRIAEKLGTAILGGTYKPHDLVPGEMRSTFDLPPDV